MVSPVHSSTLHTASSNSRIDRSAATVRLLHASDLHLERVPTGLPTIPDHLLSRLVDSAYAAARRVFETAIAENVDALILAGDVVDVSLAGPRAVVRSGGRNAPAAAPGPPCRGAVAP